MKKINIAALLLCLAVFSYAQTSKQETKPAEKNKVENPAEPVKSAPSITVEKIAVGSSVENRELLGENTVFSKDQTKVCVWAKFKTENAPQTVKFVYYREGKKTTEIPLEIKGSPYRAWTIKNIFTGSWKVEIQDETGNILAESEFKVTDEPAKTSVAETEPAPEKK